MDKSQGLSISDRFIVVNEIHPKPPPRNNSGYSRGKPIRGQMDDILHDWPQCNFNNDHIIVWKWVYGQVSATLNLGRQEDDGSHPDCRAENVTYYYKGHLGCPYTLFEPITLNGEGNWLLSPLGCLKGGETGTHIMASVGRVDDLVMREDHVLACRSGARFLPVFVMGEDETHSLFIDYLDPSNRRKLLADYAEYVFNLYAEYVYNLLHKWYPPHQYPKRCDVVKCYVSSLKKALDVYEMRCHIQELLAKTWLHNPNKFAHEIDTAESAARGFVDKAISDNQEQFDCIMTGWCS